MFRQSFQQQVAAHDLEKWATNCIAKREVSDAAASEAIRHYMSEADVSVWSDRDESIVCFKYGSGFGYWGVAIGNPKYKCNLGEVQTHWTNGIWFWHQ